MRVIRIADPVAEAAACGEASGEVPKLDLPLTRRGFLQGSGITVGRIAAGSALQALAPSPAWPVEPKTCLLGGMVRPPAVLPPQAAGPGCKPT